MNLSFRRAEVLSVVALLLHVLFFLLTFWISAYANSLGCLGEAWHFMGGVFIWVLLILQFRQRRLAQEEQLDVEQFQRLRSEGKDTSLFEGKQIEGTLHIASRRLVWLEKYLIAIFAVLLSVFLIFIGYMQFRTVQTMELAPMAGREKLLVMAAYLAGVALVSFLFSRYAVGMSQQGPWRPLRAGGSYLLSNALVCFALAVMMLIPDKGDRSGDKILGYVLSGVMLFIGAETLLNLILDAYRPRIKGQYRRAPYESRLLGLISEPEGIFKTAAHALDYQFGFKVSETWFYRLLERAFVPLILMMAVMIYLMTCLAIVPPGNLAVVERWGVPLNVQQPWQPGPHLKYPWPMDVVKTFPVEQMQFVNIGFEVDEESKDKPVLWTAKHWKEEFPFMVAVKRQPSGARTPTEALPSVVETTQGNSSPGTDIPRADETTWENFDMLVVALVVHYRIDDIAKFGYGGPVLGEGNNTSSGYFDPQALLEALCYQEMVNYAAQSDMQSLLGAGWQATTEILRERFQAQADTYGLGVKIVFVGLDSVHPPIEVGESFEKVVAALQEKQAKVLKAQGFSHAAMAQARGSSDVRLATADAYKIRRGQMALAASERFRQQIEAYEKGRDVYLWREYLATLEKNMPKMRKYYAASDQVDNWVFEYDLKEQLQPDLLEGIGIPQRGQEK